MVERSEMKRCPSIHDSVVPHFLISVWILPSLRSIQHVATNQQNSRVRPQNLWYLFRENGSIWGAGAACVCFL